MTGRLSVLILALACGASAQMTAPSQPAADPAAPAGPAVEVPDAAKLLREGTAAAESGKLGDALELLRQAADGSGDEAIRHRAMFNLGAVQLKRGQAALEEQDRERALAALRLAEQRYLGCVELDRHDVEAARNVEHVRKLIRDIRAEEKKQQEQQGDDKQGDNQQGDKGDQKADDAQQNQQDNQNQQGSQNQQGQQGQQGQPGSQDQQGQDQGDAGQGADQPPSDMQRLKDLAQQQAQQTAETRERGSPGAEQSATEQEDLRKKTEQEAANADQQDVADSLKAAAREQQAAEDSLRRGDMSEANEHQQAASKALERAYAQSVQKQLEQMLASDQPPQQAQGEEAESPAEQPQMDPIVQALIDREQSQRDARRRQGLMRSVPEKVEKDW